MSEIKFKEYGVKFELSNFIQSKDTKNKIGEKLRLEFLLKEA